ncbi:MAG: hypothetical protein ACK4V6_05690 [Microthrixaceae bacterium]
MPREDARTKSLRLLQDGRLVVTLVDRDRVNAICRGDGALHHLTVRGPDWQCSCPARGRCSHLLALGAVVAVDIPETP